MSWNKESRECLLGNVEAFCNHYSGEYTLEGLEINEHTPPDESKGRMERARQILFRLTEIVPNADHASPGWSGKKPVAILGIVSSEKGDVGKQEAAEPRRRRRSILGLCYMEGHFWLLASKWWLLKSPVGLTADWETYGNDKMDRVRRYTKLSIPAGKGVDLAAVGPLAENHVLVKQLIEPFRDVCTEQAKDNSGKVRFLVRLDARQAWANIPATAHQVIFPRVVQFAQ